jgi:hypothetical protein
VRIWSYIHQNLNLHKLNPSSKKGYHGELPDGVNNMIKQLAIAALLSAASSTCLAASDADVALQQDVTAELYATMPADCKQPLKIIQQEIIKKTTGKQPWEELWTVEACDQTHIATIRFIPDSKGSGTTFSIKIG